MTDQQNSRDYRAGQTIRYADLRTGDQFFAPDHYYDDNSTYFTRTSTGHYCPDTDVSLSPLAADDRVEFRAANPNGPETAEVIHRMVYTILGRHIRFYRTRRNVVEYIARVLESDESEVFWSPVDNLYIDSDEARHHSTNAVAILSGALMVCREYGFLPETVDALMSALESYHSRMDQYHEALQS